MLYLPGTSALFVAAATDMRSRISAKNANVAANEASTKLWPEGYSLDLPFRLDANYHHVAPKPIGQADAST